MYMKVQKVYLLQQSQSLGESHPVPAQAPPSYKKLQKAVPPRCLALRTRDGNLVSRKAFIGMHEIHGQIYPPVKVLQLFC